MKRVILLTQMFRLWGAMLGNSNMSSFLLVLSLESILKCALNVLRCTLGALSGAGARAKLSVPDERSISPFQSASISRQTQSQLKSTISLHRFIRVTDLKAHSEVSVRCRFIPQLELLKAGKR